MRFNFTFKNFLTLLLLILTSIYGLYLLERYINRPFVGSIKSINYEQEHKVEPLEKLIHQTWKTNDLPQPNFSERWKNMNPDFQYIFRNDSQVQAFVKERFPGIFPLFQNLPKAVMRADLFRYLIIYDQGGVYCDMDTEPLKPIDLWGFGHRGSANVLIAVEFDASDHIVPYFSIVQMQFIQWTFAAKRKHPLLLHIINEIIDKYRSLSQADLESISVHDLTGPTIWTKAILDYICKLGFCNYKQFQLLEEPLLVDDILILPTTSFNPSTSYRGKGDHHRLSYVKHHFLGSWK